MHPPLPAYAKEVLERLECYLSASGGRMPSDEAKERLAEEFEEATIEAAVDQLLRRGYIYKVNGQLRITEDQL